MSQVYGGSEGENAVGDEDENGGMKSLVGKLKDKAKLPTLKKKMKKLRNKMPLGRNKNNGSDLTDDDRYSQEDNHEDDSGSGGEENESNDTKEEAPVASNNPQGEVDFQPGTLPSEPHAVHDYLKKLPLDPKDQSSTTREEDNGNNLQPVGPERKGAAANDNTAGGGLTTLKNTVMGTAAAAADVVGSTIGYYSAGGENAREKNKSSASSTAGAGGKTYTQQAADTATAMKEAVASRASAANNNATTGDEETYAQKALKTVVGMKNSAVASLGLDKPSDPNAPSFLDKTKGYMTTTTDAAKSLTAGASDRAYNTRDRMLAATTPGDEHKALAQQVTETLSNLPASLKESMFGPTGSASSTLNSSAMDKTPGRDEKNAASSGLVSSITDTVSSFSSKKGATGGSSVDDHPPPFPAHQDYAPGQSLNVNEKSSEDLPVTSDSANHQPVNS